MYLYPDTGIEEYTSSGVQVREECAWAWIPSPPPPPISPPLSEIYGSGGDVGMDLWFWQNGPNHTKKKKTNKKEQVPYAYDKK